MKTKLFQVNGMTCNGCAGTVNNILAMQDGVEEVHVQFPENTAEITFDESKITEDRMIEVVGMMGYQLEP